MSFRKKTRGYFSAYYIFLYSYKYLLESSESFVLAPYSTIDVTSEKYVCTTLLYTFPTKVRPRLCVLN